MSEKLSSSKILPLAASSHELETEEVLDALRSLSRRVCSPVVRECLQEACAEIAYLTSSEGKFEDYLAREADLGHSHPSDHHGSERDAV